VGRRSTAGCRPNYQRLLLLAWVILRIDVGDARWSYAVQLDNGFLTGPREVLYALRDLHETAGLDPLSFAFVELVSHADVEHA
jgi:hypothetical protein